MIKFAPSDKWLRAFFYWLALAFIFGWAAWRRFSLPLEPIADLDTWGYLSPALEKLSGGEFVHAGRNFLYPGFLLIVLRIFGDFRAIAVVQHLLGLAGGAFMLLTWQKVRSVTVASAAGNRMHMALGLVLVTVFLLAGEPIRAEMQIRPEGICAFLLSLNLYFVVGFISRAFVARHKPPALLGAGTAMTAMLLASVKPSFVFLAGAACIPIGLFFFQRNQLRQKALLGAALVVSALVLFVPESLFGRDDEGARIFLPTTLFAVHADLIRDQMAQDIQSGAIVPYQHEWLDRMQKQVAVELEKSATAEGSRFPSLGFSPDYLMCDPSSIAQQVGREFSYDVSAQIAFYRFWYWRTWQQRPLAMLKKIRRQLALAYAPISPVYDRRKNIPLAIVYKIAALSFENDAMRPVLAGYPPAVESIRRSALLGQTAPLIQQNRLMRKALSFLARAFLPLLALTLVVSGTCVKARLRKSMGWLATLTLLVFAYHFAACFEVAIIQVFDGPRYSTVLFCFTLLAEFLALRLVLEALLHLIRWGRPIQTSAPGE
jgi:hypothetical protein